MNLIDSLGATVGVELWLPGSTAPTLQFGLTENSIKRTKQRVITPTERSYAALPAFGKTYAQPWELNQVAYQHEVLQLEDLVTIADTLLTHETQQYLILYDYGSWINVTMNPEYIPSVIPNTLQTISGVDYAHCAHNVYVESLEIDATYPHLDTIVSFTLTLNEVR
jgi:hypothetical protein